MVPVIKSPERGEIHVWYLWSDRITDPARLSSHAEMLTDEERDRNQAFRFPKDRHSHLLTRAFVRTLLTQYANGVKPSEWRFSRTAYGKPEIDGPPGMRVDFSLSHTAGLIVCAISGKTPIGIDAENVEQRSVDQMEIAEKYFSRMEYESLRGLPEAERHRRFFEYWTLKESYAKARGLGMSLDLSLSAFQIDDRRISVSFDAGLKDDPSAWQFRLFNPGPQHLVAASMCFESGGAANFHERDGTALMQ